MSSPYRLLTGILLLQNSLICMAAQPDEAASPATASSLYLAPTEHIYSPYLADQRRVTFGLQILSIADSDIPDTGQARFALRMGGRLELFHWDTGSDPDEALQANLEVGFRGHFDIDNSQDNIGWDGNYGLLFSYRSSEALAWRFGLYHTSSHVGDEYAERTGRKRISYTREEFLTGLQFNFTPNWQSYLEAGYGYHQAKKPLQERYRVQTGLQYQQASFSNYERPGWYAGLDLSAYEERDWSINKALQVGFAFSAAPHIWRLALDYYDGQAVIGEFFQHQERYVGLSLYLDV